MSIAAGYGSAAQLQDQVRALIEENAALRKDAERYRWLRREHASDGPSYHVRRPSNCPAPRDLDADLDAAMKGANT